MENRIEIEFKKEVYLTKWPKNCWDIFVLKTQNKARHSRGIYKLKEFIYKYQRMNNILK